MKTKRSEKDLYYAPTDFRKLGKYKNQFVAFDDDQKNIVAYGKDSTKVMEKAWKLGVKAPLIFRVPKDLTYKVLIV